MASSKATRSDRPRASRGRGLRTNTGCITCRKRHVKCDETKPVCHQCIRNKKSCAYAYSGREPVPRGTPTHGPDLGSDAEICPEASAEASIDLSEFDAQDDISFRAHQRFISRAGPGALARSSNHSDDGQELQRQSQRTLPLVLESQDQTTESDQMMQTEREPELGTPRSERGPVRVLPVSASMHDGFSNADYTSPTSIGTVSDQPIGIATARWFGMLADDADISLDANHNLPTTVVEGGQLETNYNYGADESGHTHDPGAFEHATNIVASQDRRLVTQELQPQQPAEEILWQSAVPLDLSQEQQTMFQAFITHVSEWMDLFDPYRHFASLVPRLALYNIGLLNAILALSIRHNSLSREPAFGRQDALQYYHRTLQYVRRAMQYTSYHISLELLATTLIISAYEMLDGSSRDWERHLQGVFWIQRSQRIHGDSGGLRAAVWWAWLCQDVWAAFRDKRRVFTFWKPERTMPELDPVHLAARSVFVLGRVINYCAEDDSDNTTDGIVSKIRSAEKLSAMLDEWETLLTPNFLPLPCNLRNPTSIFQTVWIHPPIYAVAVQIHHASRILVLIHQPSLGGINAGLRRQSSLDRHVDTICGIALTLNDYGSSTMCSQCLFVGLCTHDRQRRHEILRLLEHCRIRSGWPVVPLGEELEEHWKNSTTTQINKQSTNR